MSLLLAATGGYLLGSLPTARWIAELRGVDLLTEGSGNPGANNALRTGGPFVAVSVLIVEASKGWLAVGLGSALGGDESAVIAGLMAILGNVYNVWLGFRGGKGLGISLGVLIGLWPLALIPAVASLGAVALATRSSGTATLVALAVLTVLGAASWAFDLPTGGVQPPWTLAVAAGMTIVMSWKHWRDSPFSAASRTPTPESA